MRAKAIDTWMGCFAEGDEFDVLGVHGYYILIEESNGRLVWNYKALFEISGDIYTGDSDIPFTINWNII